MPMIEMATDLERSAEAIATCGPFLLLPTSVVATRPATFEEWEEALTRCRRTEKASPWWVVWLLEFGEAQFGDQYHQALADTDYTKESLQDIAYVARNVEPSRRRDGLTFSHHREVAPLSPEEQTKWLDEAEALDLSVHQLRQRIQGTKALAQPREFWLSVLAS
jgi:hypothetical protein